MWGFPTKPKCPNCGGNEWQVKKDFECPKCGYKTIESRDAGEATLVYCEECACHYLSACTSHDLSKVQPVKVKP
jgi:hypothetical protein